MENLSVEDFAALIADITRQIDGKPVNAELEGFLNEVAPADGALFNRIFDACKAAIAAGWMCKYEAGGVKYGRVLKPTQATHGFSVDVVEMDSVKGPHHRHPKGEIDMIMPLDAEAKFDGRGKGWLVYPAGHAHYPTLTAGKAIVLYLLPDGAIEFTKQ